MTATVSPSAFDLVDFDAAEIAALADELAAAAGLPTEVPVIIEIDETTSFGRTAIASVDPVRIEIQSGAFESPKQRRTFSREHATDVLGRYLHRLVDRRTPGFADAPDEADLTLEQRCAWNVYAAGRLARLGYAVQRQRWLYQFRNRHGFTDAADAVFDTLWSADGLDWHQVRSLSECAAAANPGAIRA